MAIITGGIIGAFSAAIDFFAYFWLPSHLGSSIKPLGTDYSAVSIMSHLLGFSPTTWQEFWALHALYWWLINGAIPALAVGLYCGGAACLQHFVLRFLLWCAQDVPFNYARFLDYASERILLRKVGGGYVFMHSLLLDHFAQGETLSAPMSGQKASLLPIKHESQDGSEVGSSTQPSAQESPVLATWTIRSWRKNTK